MQDNENNDDFLEDMPDYSAFLAGDDESENEGFSEDFFLPEEGFEFEDEDESEAEDDEAASILPEFFILWDAEQDFYYITDEGRFFVYTDPDFPIPDERHCVGKSVECAMDELFTTLYNHGFTDGYLDNRLITLKKSEILFWDRNPNSLYYQRYLKSKDGKWLSKLQKNKLWTLCKVTKKNEALFAIVTDSETNDSYLLAFTDKKAIAPEIKEKYPDFSAVRNPLLGEPFLINFETTYDNRKEIVDNG